MAFLGRANPVFGRFSQAGVGLCGTGYPGVPRGSVACRRMSEGPPEDGAEEAAPPRGSGGVAPPAIPLDADATQSMHFRRLLRHPVTLSLGLTFLIAAFVGGTVGGGPAVGGGGAVAVFLLVLLIVYVLASNAAKEDFFSSYASTRGLSRQSGRGHLPPTTPLLRKGDNRYTEEIMDGALPGGLPGAIGLYTYEEKTRDSDGNEDTTYYKFTVVMHDPARRCAEGQRRLLPATLGLPLHGLGRGQVPADAAAGARERRPRLTLRDLLRGPTTMSSG